MTSRVRAIAMMVSVLGAAMVSAQQSMPTTWPGGHRAAIVLTYDDALRSQLDNAVPALDAAGFKGTFFLSGTFKQEDVDRWRAVAKEGHELGNHTVFHPCAKGSFDMPPQQDTANYSVAWMLKEIGAMNTMLAAIDGKPEHTFATPCGQHVAGGEDYLPALRTSGLTKYVRAASDPGTGTLDPFDVPSTFFPDTVTGTQLIAYVEKVRAAGSLGVMGFHGVGGDYLIVPAAAHKELVEYLKAHEDDIWVAPFGEVMDYVAPSITISWRDMRVLVCLAVLAFLPSVAVAQDRPLCHDWTECRQFALKAYTDHDYDAFYDFARRSLAAGPPRDAKLLLILARAESLNGRVDDARRTLERLAKMGVKVDIAGHDDFENLRAGLDRRPAGSTSAPGAASPLRRSRGDDVDREPVTPVASSSATASALPDKAVEIALRIPATRISPTGLAYDHVSGRFLMVDSGSDKLVSVDELSRHMVDLVKADSAGFRDITAFEIDTRRGDLRVVSAGKPGGTDHESVTALHKLQLISGRPLAKFQPGDGFGDTRFEDVAVATSATSSCSMPRAARSSTGAADDDPPYGVPAAAGSSRQSGAHRRPRGDRVRRACRRPRACRSRHGALDAGGRVEIPAARRPRAHPLRQRPHRRDPARRRWDSARRVDPDRRRQERPAQSRSNGSTASMPSQAARSPRLSGDDVYFLTREAGHDGDDGEFVVQRARVR